METSGGTHQGNFNPRVEMLWESTEPNETLTRRFGFKNSADAATWLVATLIERYGITVTDVERIVISESNALAWLHSDVGALVAKWSRDTTQFARLAALANLTEWLGAQGIPVSRLISPHNHSGTEAAQIELDSFSFGLQRVIDGDLLDITDANAVREAGATLARLNELLRRYPKTAEITGANAASDAFKPLADRIEQWLASTTSHLPQMAVDRLRSEIAAIRDADLPLLPDPHLVHGDFRAANLLCRGGKVAAVIDFEQAHREHAVVDLALACVLIGTKFHNWGPTPPSVRRTFLAGYTSITPFTAAERGWLPSLILWFSLVMIPDGDDPTGWSTAARQHAEAM